MNSKVIFDAESIKKAITRISYEMIEQHKSLDHVVLIGIKTRGITIAKRIAERLKVLEHIEVPVAELNITFFRDDIQHDPSEVAPVLPFSIVGKKVILVDDVLYTGRTIRAALDAIISMGRPQSIALAVLVDRGHRELPIRPDFVGKNIPTSKDESIKVYMMEDDGLEQIVLHKNTV